jgi:nucleoside-diphosphate-sugar epimerase
MNILLTGANGFVGSHLLDRLRASHHNVSVLLQPTSNTRFIARHLPDITVHYGSVGDLPSLYKAMETVEAVIHCAGKTKALRPSEFYRINHDGTRNVVKAANDRHRSLRHLMVISSQAVSGPGSLQRPARESDTPHPVSVYGHSKLQGENEVRRHSRVPWTVLRPAAVYGPRDRDFLNVFIAVKRRIMPILGGGARPISLIYGPDVAAAAMACLACNRAVGRIYHVAAEPPCTDEELMREIAAQLQVRAVRIRIPRAALYLSCLLQELQSRLSGRAAILSFQKMPELLAPGWACSTARIREDLDYTAPTQLSAGVAQTLSWYHRKGWM